MTTRFLSVLATVTVLCLAAIAVCAQSYSNAVMSLNPAGYWPMHESESPAPGDSETNYGTLGLFGTGFYPDWASSPAVSLKRQHAGPFTVPGNTDVSVNFTHNLITGSTEQFTNMLFVPHASPLTTLNPPFSVECWFCPTNLSTGVDIWSQCGDEGLNAGAEGGTIGNVTGMRLVWVNSTFVIYAMNNQYDTGSANSNRLVFQDAAVASNQWYHLVVTCDANTNVALFTNGVQAVTTVAAVARYSPDYWTPLTVGGGYGATRSIAGYVSEFAVYTNALQPADIAAHYSDGVNVGASQYYNDVIASNPAIYLRMNSPAYSPPAFATLPVLRNLGTTNGVAVGNGVYSAGTAPGVLSGPGSAFAAVTNSSPLFSGVSSFGDAGFASAYNPTGSNVNFTVTAMFRGYPGDGRIQTIVGHGTNSWQLTLTTNGCIVFNAGNGNNKTTGGTGQASGDVTTTGAYNDGNWHQVVVVNQTNVVSIYVDTGLDTNGTPGGVTGTNFIPGNSSDVLIGSDPSYTNTPAGVGRSFAGQVCEVAFFTNALTAAQIDTLYGNSGVIVAPSILAQPPTGRVVNGGPGTSIQFDVTAKGTPALVYQWYFNTTSNYVGAAQLANNAVHYVNVTTAQLTVTNLTGNDTGYYFVVVTNQFGSATSIVASLTVNTSPTIVSQSPLTYTNLFALYPGANPTFAVTVAGTAPFSYQWFTNGVLDGTAITNTLQMTNVQDSFTNYCIIANVSGSVTSSWAALIFPYPTNSTGGLAPYPQSVLALNPIGYWRMNDSSEDGADNGNGDNGYVCHDYAGGNDGLYTNCYIGELDTYDPAADPSDTSAQFGEESSIDFGDSLAFGIAGVNFATPAGMSGAFSIEAWVSGYEQTTAGAGIVTLGYGGGGEQFSLDCGAPNNAFRFFFRDASGAAHVINSLVETTTAPGLGPWYHLAGVVDEANGEMALYINGQLAGTTAITAASGVMPSPYLMDIGSRMGNQNTNYNYQFLGNINDVAVFNYALSSNQVVNEYLNAGNIAPYLMELPPTNETIAAGSSLTISAEAGGTGPLGYYWTDVNAHTNVAGGATSGMTLNASITINNIPAAWNGDQLELTVTNAFGTTNFYVSLSVLTAPSILTNIPPQFTLAQGRSYTYTVGAVGASPLEYQWYLGSSPIPGQTNSTYTLTASSTGVFNYTVVVSNYLGTATSVVSTVTVVPMPVSAYATNILNLNPVGYWPMHEQEASAPGDIETNYGSLGVLGNGYYPDWAATPPVSILRQQSGPMAGNSDPDSAVSFTHYVSNLSTPAFTNGLFVPHSSPSTTLNPPFTVECWFYPINLGPGAPLWSQTGDEGLNAGTEGGGQGYVTGIFLNWAQGGFVGYILDDSLDGTFGNPQKIGGGSGGTEFLGSNVWYHVVITCDANTNMTYFTNGVVCQRTFADAGNFSPDYWTPLSICSGSGNEKSLAGTVAEFAVYTNALATNEIAYHYAIGTNPNPQTNYFTAIINDDPVIYFRMDSPSYSAPPVNTWPLLYNYGIAGVNGVYTPGTVPGVLPGPSNDAGAPLSSFSGTNVAELSGISSYADAGNAPAFNPVGRTPFSVTAMFRGNPCDGRVQDIVGHSDNSWRILMNTNGALQCAMGIDGNNVVNSAGIYNDGNWHQVVDVYQPASNPNVTGTNLLYVDGVLDTTVTGANTNGIAPGSTSDVVIGSDPEYTNSPAGVGRQFAGQICEVAVFTNALSATQVQSLYQAAVSSGVNTNPTNIVYSLTDNVLTLSWPADHTGWQLQMQTDSLSVGINTNWVNVAGSTSTNRVVVPINPANGSVFYRLVYP